MSKHMTSLLKALCACHTWHGLSASLRIHYNCRIAPIQICPQGQGNDGCLCSLVALSLLETIDVNKEQAMGWKGILDRGAVLSYDHGKVGQPIDIIIAEGTWMRLLRSGKQALLLKLLNQFGLNLNIRTDLLHEVIYTAQTSGKWY